MFVCLFLFVWSCFVCLFDSFVELFAFDYFLFDKFAGMVRQYKSMSHDWTTVKTVAHETVRHMT